MYRVYIISLLWFFLNSIPLLFAQSSCACGYHHHYRLIPGCDKCDNWIDFDFASLLRRHSRTDEISGKVKPGYDWLLEVEINRFFFQKCMHEIESITNFVGVLVSNFRFNPISNLNRCIAKTKKTSINPFKNRFNCQLLQSWCLVELRLS